MEKNIQVNHTAPPIPPSEKIPDKEGLFIPLNVTGELLTCQRSSQSKHPAVVWAGERCFTFLLFSAVGLRMVSSGRLGLGLGDSQELKKDCRNGSRFCPFWKTDVMLDWLNCSEEAHLLYWAAESLNLLYGTGRIKENKRRFYYISPHREGGGQLNNNLPGGWRLAGYLSKRSLFLTHILL